MSSKNDQLNRIQRSFRELSDSEINEFDQLSLLVDMGWSEYFGWEELLKSPRVLIISEAGAGKTHECQAQQRALWESGEAAFYLDLAELSRNDLRDLLSLEEEKRLDAWLVSQSDVATLFLDSIDELKLTLGSFDVALKRLSKALAGQLARVRIVITTRPIPVDYQLIQRHLPIPETGEAVDSEEAFADIAMERGRGHEEQDAVPSWRNTALMPLSNDQIREMASIQGVNDPDALLEDIRKRDAEEFARRPQDLIELCTDWRDQRRIRTHREQVANNIAVKLKPREDRGEKTPLSADRAFEGASRLALAAHLTRKLTLRHSAEADKGGEPGTALDPAVVLSDWTADERETLLERALFGFASYGRVRFHHRSVIEYLTAQRLESMLDNGMSMKALKRLLFAETPPGLKVVRPSMRPIAAWLSNSRLSIFSEVRDREPEVLFNHGDPESLTPSQRNDTLRVYVERYGRGGRRGLHVPRVQVHRFASNELAEEVQHLWNEGVENAEVRELMLELMASVPMEECADIVYSVASQGNEYDNERLEALVALINLNDSRLDALTSSMETDPASWPNDLLKAAVVRVFPAHISVDRLCRILPYVTESERTVGNLSWVWPRRIAEVEVDPAYLEGLREGLTNLVLDGVERKKDAWPRIVTPRRDLVAPLLAACHRQMSGGDISANVITSSVAALRLGKGDSGRNEPAEKLRVLLEESSAEVRRLAFWADDAFVQRYHPQDDPWNRLFEVKEHGAVKLEPKKDLSWVLEDLSDSARSAEERSLMLEAAIRSVWDGDGEWRDYVKSLKRFVADSQKLTSHIDDLLKPASIGREQKRWKREQRKRKRQEKRRQAKNHASWVMFWREVAKNPETAFSPEKSENTVWNLWQAMERSGDESRASGWNRRFMERHFSTEIADRMRLALMQVWRNEKPTLRSERPDGEKGTYLYSWVLGVAAIAAESEDPNWAVALSAEEAELAARYAPTELNGFPSWLESLAAAHPAAVEGVLGPELTNELDEIAVAHTGSMFLQNISYAAPALATLFLPRLLAWFDENAHRIRKSEDPNGVTERLRRVIDVLLEHGGDEVRERVANAARSGLEGGLNTDLAIVWLPTLMRLDPVDGTHRLEKGLENAEPQADGKGVRWIARLFDERHGTNGVDVRVPEFTPALRLRLVRLAYHHVRTSDDISHEGVYSPGLRDHAQSARSALLDAVLAVKGPEGWAAKLELADDPLLAHFRERALLLAKENAAMEMDSVVLTESEVAAFDRNGETSPSTRDDMFALMNDRLDDLEDLMLRDDSPRAAWAGITDEKVMRRVIAHELVNAANQAYTIDQEGVTADEKETDIRFRATSGQQAVIELKIGDKPRSGRELRDTIKKQLVTKYMGPDCCRAGCLLVTIASDKGWLHPDSNDSLDAAGLETMLQEEAARVVTDMGASLRLTARVLDLRPRLPTEK